MALDKLRMERTKRNFTYQEVANKVGITKEYYWMIENGKRQLKNYELAVKIARVFDTKPDDLFLDNKLTTSEQNEKQEAM
ncbi:helix-turn-helix transcriptional regulator [Gracilibacillus dipsosauri]|uniref:XRE family transcriptional regulator n=1 Tax=Gracilibacillus dipsosauri TaxID=178340 RepID=A0A317KTD9_9BACI|nr:helix-turn-helix transcriptional regulator [Gracilibacillus dipsosauri]PWU66543.1 XRE family transcriptional regulator [Gracilibacillus dipsosauri]